MSGFDERERAFESKFAHDAEMQFRAAARRNKHLGLWLASHFGLEGDEADVYAKSVVAADLQEAGDEDVIRKVMADVAEKGVGIDEAKIRAQLKTFEAQAKDELMKEVD